MRGRQTGCFINGQHNHIWMEVFGRNKISLPVTISHVSSERNYEYIIFCERIVVQKKPETFYVTSSSLHGAGIALLVWVFAAGWTVRGSDPSGVEISRTRPERPWDPPTSYIRACADLQFSMRQTA
jgi:hypothetical protein